MFFPVFLSVVIVTRNQAPKLKEFLSETNRFLSTLVNDFEMIVVDNASTDESTRELKELTKRNGLPNLQVFALTKEVDLDTANWVGLETALGDFVLIFDPRTDDITFVSTMLNQLIAGADVVFATNKNRTKRRFVHRFGFYIFNHFYKLFNGICLDKDIPHFRLLSKKVVNFILMHKQPALTYRHMPATSGFIKVNLSYATVPREIQNVNLIASIDRGMRMLVSSTRGPMRIVTTLSLFGGVANLLYSTYVIGVAFFKADVAPGWVTLSLQQSGMFFLFSMVLLVLGEYILQMASLSNEGPLYHIAQEFSSEVITRRQKLNVEYIPGKTERKSDNFDEYTLI